MCGWYVHELINGKDEAKKRGIEIQIDARSEKSVEELLGTFDVLLLGPQVRYVLKSMEKLLDGKHPVEVVNMKDYGTMNGAKVLDQALRMYNDFYK